jgi:dipeptidyl aminopeptidase/acylaminoacyl peptidase
MANLSSVAVSPNGKRVAFREERASIERNTYETVWYVKSLDEPFALGRVSEGGEPLRDDAGIAISEPPSWSSDSRWIYYRATFDAQVQVWRAAWDGSRVEQVTHDPADIESFALSGDGHQLLYTTHASREDIRAAEQQEYDRGIRIDGTVNVGQNLFRSSYYNGRLASRRLSGRWFSRQGLLADSPLRRKVIDVATFSVREVVDADLPAFGLNEPQAPPAEAVSAVLAVRSVDGNRVGFLVGSGDTRELRARLDEHASASTVCRADACRKNNIVALAWRPNTDELVFTTLDRQEGRRQSLYSWDVNRNTVRLIVRGEGQLNGGGEGSGTSCSLADEIAVCVVSSPNVPPQVRRVNLKTGAQDLLFAPNSSLVDASATSVQYLQWRAPDGQLFTGQFFPARTPYPNSPAPLFVTYYVCDGYVRSGVVEEWPLPVFADAGIAALCINEPLAFPDQVKRYTAALNAVQSAVALLSQRGLVDAAHVGMGGLSFGTEVTMWVATHSDLLSAASITSPFISPVYYWFHAAQNGDWRESLMHRWGVDSPDKTPEQWKRVSPPYFIDRVKAPFLMQMPEEEYLNIMDTFTPLANSTTPTELYAFPNEFHIKYMPRHKLAAAERNLDWFRFWLQGYKAQNPEKREQYARWERLRGRQQASGEKAATAH